MGKHVGYVLFHQSVKRICECLYALSWGLTTLMVV